MALNHDGKLRKTLSLERHLCDALQGWLIGIFVPVWYYVSIGVYALLPYHSPVVSFVQVLKCYIVRDHLPYTNDLLW